MVLDTAADEAALLASEMARMWGVSIGIIIRSMSVDPLEENVEREGLQ